METVTKQMIKDGWIDAGSDINWDEHGGVWARPTSTKENESEFVIVTFEPKGVDLIEHHTTNIFLIDYDDMTEDDKTSVAQTFDVQDTSNKLEMCVAYAQYWGAYHLNADEITSRNNAKRLRAQAIRDANAYCSK